MSLLYENYKEYELDNGLVVALKKRPTKTILGKLKVNFSVYHEEENERGIAHFLEHCLVTGGSKKYNPNQVDNIISSFGSFRASTSLNEINLNVGLLPESLERWIGFVSDSVFNPRFDKQRIEGERRRVIREIQDEESGIFSVLNKEIENKIYRGHPKEIRILGKESTINNIKKEDLIEFHSRGFHPNNMDLILVGNLNENIEEIIEEYFGSYKRGKYTRLKEEDFPFLKPFEEKLVYHEHNPSLYNKEAPEKSSAIIGFFLYGPPSISEEIYAYKILFYILGGETTHSRLYKNVGLEKGLAYDTSANHDGSYNAGISNVRLSVPALKIQESFDAVFNEFEKLKRKGITQEELNEAKRSVKYIILYDFDSNKGYMDIIDRKFWSGDVPEDIVEKFNKVTKEDVREVANKYLPGKDDNYVLYIEDPLK